MTYLEDMILKLIRKVVSLTYLWILQNDSTALAYLIDIYKGMCLEILLRLFCKLTFLEYMVLEFMMKDLL